MGDTTLSVLASSQAAEGGGNNFLVPNGTFFFVLAIFLIVLAVIGTFVVPPILKVLRERDADAAQTLIDRIEERSAYEPEIAVEPELVVRGSTGPPKGA